MTSGQSLAAEAFFGPPSEAIKVADFLHEVVQLDEAASRAVFAPSAESLPAREWWEALPEERRASIEAECRYVFPLQTSPPAFTRGPRKKEKHNVSCVAPSVAWRQTSSPTPTIFPASFRSVG